MSIIKITVNDQDLVVTQKPVIASEGIEEDVVKFTFSSEWTNMGKTAVFFNAADKDTIYTAAVDENGIAVVPWEATQKDGAFYIGVYGTITGGTVQTSNLIRYNLEKGIYTEGSQSEPPTPSIVTQFMSLVGQLQNATDALDARLDVVEASSGSDGSVVLYGGDDLANKAQYTETTYTLSQAAENFAYIDIYMSVHGSTQIKTIPAPEPLASGETAKLWTLTGNFIAAYGDNAAMFATFMVTFEGTTFTIGMQQEWTEAANGTIQRNIIRSAADEIITNTYIYKIVGRNEASAEELADVRIGFDGTAYNSAGTAVRTQVEELDTGLNFVDGQETTVTLSDNEYIAGIIQDNGKWRRSGQSYKSWIVPRQEFWKRVYITAQENRFATVTFLNTGKEGLPSPIPNDTDASSYFCTGETGRHEITKNTTAAFDIPADCVSLCISYISGGTDYQPTAVKVYGVLTDRINVLEDYVENTIEPKVDAWEEFSEATEAEMQVIPDYYFENNYLDGRIDAILAKRDEMSANSDSFFFITDYHHRYNEGHSPALLKYIAARTGITKLVNAGDNGGNSAITEQYKAARLTAAAIDKTARQVPEPFCVLGNHEWNDWTDGQEPPVEISRYSTAGVIAYYLERYKLRAGAFDPESGNYWVENPVNKIRYFFIQDWVNAAPLTEGTGSNKTLDWFYQELLTVPDGWSVAAFVHFAYIPAEATVAEYNGVVVQYGSPHSISGVSRMMAACRDKKVYVFGNNTATYDFTGLTGTRHVLGVFSGHLHHGNLYTGSQVEGIEDVAVFRGSTDCLHASSITLNGHPWFWENETVGGTQVERTAGTIYEQCFYVVQIDLDNKLLYIHAIGGDHDWSGYFEQ